MRPRLDPPWLELPLPAPHRVLSWSLTRPGFVTADLILWREVRDADLPEDFDAARWLRAEIAARGRPQAVAMLTSRDLAAHETATATAGDVAALCVATVGLSNAERIGTRRERTGGEDGGRDGGRRYGRAGTINIAAVLNAPLSEAAQIEALTVAAEARTAAVIEAGHRLPTGIATGTGTDCIALAVPPGDIPYAGLHTAAGEALGRAVYEAVRRGARAWCERMRGGDRPR